MLDGFITALIDTGRDVFAVSALLFGFQYLVLRQPIPHLRRSLAGLAMVVVGLAFFLIGLELALFPLGELMATQLSSPQFVFGSDTVPDSPPWWKYGWVYLFAAIIGFSTTLAEPALNALGLTVEELTSGAFKKSALMWAVSVGVGVGIALGVAKIIYEIPLATVLLPGLTSDTAIDAARAGPHTVSVKPTTSAKRPILEYPFMTVPPTRGP